MDTLKHIKGYRRKDTTKTPAIVFTDEETKRTYVVELSKATAYTKAGEKYNQDYYNIYNFIATKNSKEVEVYTETSNGIRKVNKTTQAELDNDIIALNSNPQVTGYAYNKKENKIMYIYTNKNDQQIGVQKLWK